MLFTDRSQRGEDWVSIIRASEIVPVMRHCAANASVGAMRLLLFSSTRTATGSGSAFVSVSGSVAATGPSDSVKGPIVPHGTKFPVFHVSCGLKNSPQLTFQRGGFSFSGRIPFTFAMSSPRHRICIYGHRNWITIRCGFRYNCKQKSI